MSNLDKKTVEGFGKEWSRYRYDIKDSDGRDVAAMFDSYFGWTNDEILRVDRTDADFGCGSGRWAALVASHVRSLLCIDASTEALGVARTNLAEFDNCQLMQATIGDLPVPDQQFDFGYSLGVLHHVPDTVGGLRDCVRTLKPGAPFLLYLYYALDNRPVWYRLLWKLTNFIRRSISKLPHPIKVAICESIAVFVYWPLARASRAGERFGLEVANWPLSFYRDRSLYVLRNDALDRFGTRLEKRFTKMEVKSLMERCGLRDIRFSPDAPYWVAVGWKA